jgi:hypothetical protein
LDWVPSTASVPQPSAGTTNEYFERLLPNATYLRSIWVVTKEWRLHLVLNVLNFLECEEIEDKESVVKKKYFKKVLFVDFLSEI